MALNSSHKTKKRVFIAINLPAEIKGEVFQFLEEMREINRLSEINRVKADNLHFTLHFLGYLDGEQINQVSEILRIRSKNYRDKIFELEIKGPIGFPDLNHPKVIFLEAAEVANHNLSDLQKDLGRELERAGFKVDSRPWKAHITLGRVKSLNSELKIPEREIKQSRFEIKSVELMESRLSPQGARYEILEGYSL